MVRATLTILTKPMGKIEIVTNAEPFIVDLESKQPKQDFANILNYNSFWGTAKLDVGKRHQIEKNDVFAYYSSPLGPTYYLKIKEVYDDYSISTLEDPKKENWLKEKFLLIRNGLYLNGDNGSKVFYIKPTKKHEF